MTLTTTTTTGPVLRTTRTTHDIDALTMQNIAQALWMKEYDESKIPQDILEKIKSTKNSNSSFGSRQQARINDLLAHQLSFVTSREDRYKVLLEYAKSLSPQQCYAQSLMLGPESVTGYQAIPEDPKFTFPQIDAPQLKSQVGWHFFVGNFTDAKGHHYSVQLMFWQYTLLSPPLAASLGLSDIENQVVEIHLAVCDPQKQKQYRSTTAPVAGTTGLIDFQAKPYTYRVGKNVIKGLNANGDLFPVNLNVLGFDRSNEADPDQIEINISVVNNKGYFMEGQDGCAPSIDGIGTLYYSASLLNLKQGTDSTITINGEVITLTGGSMWYDHQWGTGFMPTGAPAHSVLRASQNINPSAPGGWDWFMMQFHHNDKIGEGEVQLTLSALHTNENAAFYYNTGVTPPGIMTAKFNGKYIDAKNTASNVTGVMQVTEWVKINFSPDPKVYPPTGTWYPAKYQFMVDGDIPAAIKLFNLTPLIASGQSGFFGNGLQYIEGGAVITDSMGQEIGRGFAEGTNWADSNAAIVALAGLPVNEQTKGFMKAPAVSFAMKALSFIWVLIKAKELKAIMAKAKGL